MSSGVECEFREWEPGRWFYILGSEEEEEMWDWRETATAYGPFHDKEEARKHLRDNHSNPGGSSTVVYDPARRPDRVLEQLIAEARDPRTFRW